MTSVSAFLVGLEEDRVREREQEAGTEARGMFVGSAKLGPLADA
jgi:hypothetical protein